MHSAVAVSLLILSSTGFSTGLKIQYDGTVSLRKNVPDHTSEVLVDDVLLFSCQRNITMEKRESESWKSMAQRVHGYQDDSKSLFSPVMKDVHQADGSIQWVFVCDEDNVNFTRAYMKIGYNNSFISFYLRNESWTPSNNLAAVILKSLATEYALKGRIILQEECIYWDKQRKGGGSGAGSGGVTGGVTGGGSGGGSDRLHIGIIVALVFSACVAGIII